MVLAVLLVFATGVHLTDTTWHSATDTTVNSATDTTVHDTTVHGATMNSSVNSMYAEASASLLRMVGQQCKVESDPSCSFDSAGGGGR